MFENRKWLVGMKKSKTLEERGGCRYRGKNDANAESKDDGSTGIRLNTILEKEYRSTH